MKFKELSELWLEEKRMEIKKSTFFLYKYCVRKYLLPNLSETKTRNLSERKVREVFDSLLRGDYPLKATTAKNITMILRQILRFASEHGFMKPIQIDMRIGVKKKIREPEVFDIDEQRIMMKKLLTGKDTDGKKLCIAMSLSLGLRIGEACALRLKDVDFHRGVVSINGTVQRINGELVLGSPKTEKSKRTIPIPNELISVLKKTLSSPVLSEATFLVSKTEKPTDPRVLRRFFHDFCVRNKIRPLKFHSLRHSFATRCIESGVDCKTVSEILGHASISTTLNLYAHPSMDAKRKCVNRVKLL